jgi:hypothetical protein
MEENNQLQKGALYKIKDGKHLDKVEEYLSKYVYIQEFAKNPLKEGEWYCIYFYMFKDTLNPTSYIYSTRVLLYDTFQEYFELDMDYREVNKKIYELEKLETKNKRR